jgi:hypothetical protein
MTKQLRQFKNKQESLPDGFTSSYVKSNPALYHTYVHLGDYYREMKNFDRSYFYYSAALRHKLPGRDEEKKLRGILEELQNKIDHGNFRH